MGVVWAWLLVSLPIKAAPARPTDLQLRSTVRLPGFISSGWPESWSGAWSYDGK